MFIQFSLYVCMCVRVLYYQRDKTQKNNDDDENDNIYVYACMQVCEIAHA